MSMASVCDVADANPEIDELQLPPEGKAGVVERAGVEPERRVPERSSERESVRLERAGRDGAAWSDYAGHLCRHSIGRVDE